MTQSLPRYTWVQENFLSFMSPHHSKEAPFACSSPRPDFRPSPVPAPKQTHQVQSAKRKRDDSDESQLPKRIKAHANLQTPPNSVTPPQQPSSSNFVQSAALPPRQEGNTGSLPEPQGNRTSSAPGSTPPGEQSSVSEVPASARVDSLTSTVEDAQHSDKPPDDIATASATSRAGIDAEAIMKNRVIERIESQLNLMILEKHEEQRLAETELGKCQMALEQLRRVHLVPYPHDATDSMTAENVITGTGSAIQPSPGFSRPPHPSPHGVVDGPYARHYAKWLIPSEVFDAAPPRLPRSSTTGLAIPPRKRTSLEDQTPVRLPKRSTSSQNQQLPTVTIIDADGVRTLAAQRPDGEWVKVVCKKCGKRDAANLQGFTNHTRISHNLSFANHKEAINECGQPLDESEAAQVAERNAEQQQQHYDITGSAVSTPLRIPKPSIPPLAITGGSKQSTAGRRTQNFLDAKDWRSYVPSTPTIASPVSASVPNSAKSSAFPRSPNASKLLSKVAKEGLQIDDFNRMVESSKEKINLDQVPSLAGPENEDDQSSRSKPQVSRMPARAAVVGPDHGNNTANATVRSKPTPLSTQQHPPYPASRVPTMSRPTTIPNSFSSDATISFGRQQTTPTLEVPHEDSPNHSPRTIDTNPGLVSDHEDESDVETHTSEHGGDSAAGGRESLAHVRVSGEPGDDSFYHNAYQVQDYDGQCHPGASHANPAYHPGQHQSIPFDQAIPQEFFHQTLDNFQAGAAPPSQKKKRGRPPKKEQQPHV